MIGPAGPGPDEEPPTASAALRIILVPCVFSLPSAGRKHRRGQRPPRRARVLPARLPRPAVMNGVYDGPSLLALVSLEEAAIAR